MFTNVIVLTPNGRRQNVKITPNTTILQVLEETCRKHNLNPEEFDLKHHRNILDTSITLRFSGLPNNAQLEMVPINRTRNDSDLVIIGVQLEDGRRVIGNFASRDKLIDILKTLCPNEVKFDENPVIVYMRTEIYGDNLKITSLRDLGLTSGRAMIRLIHKSPDELKTQANVSTPLPAKPVAEKPYVRKLQKIEEPQENVKTSENPILKADDGKIDIEKECSKKKESPENKVDDLLKNIKQEKRKQTEKLPMKSSKKVAVKPEVEEDAEDFVFLGERNAMLFSTAMSKMLPSEELLDDFFELTIDDAKKLLKDLKKQRLSYENGKLKTSVTRELEESKKQLRLLSQYKRTIIRVQFPNGAILQGTFLPVETVGHVMEFVREYLDNKSMEFYLFTTPPKEILIVDNKLIDVGCVPGALVHFGSNVGSNVDENDDYLRRDLRGKFTSFSKASLAASKVRKTNSRHVNFDSDEDEDEDSKPVQEVNVGASTSSGVTYENYPGKKETVPSEKAPKWFKHQ